MLEVQGLDARYGPIRALTGINLTIAGGGLVALIGGNGAGKTTLLRVLSGLLPAAAGTVRLAGRDITALDAAARVRSGLIQVPEGRQVLAPLSVEDNLLLGGYTRSRRERAEGLERAYAMFPPLEQRRRTAAGLLSGGQQQMLAIARALMARPRLLLLDEPSMGLSPILVDEVFETIVRLAAAGTTVFVVEQNAFRALSVAERAYVLEAGRVILEGEAAALKCDDRVREAYLGL